jgi:hypothetical protein
MGTSEKPPTSKKADEPVQGMIEDSYDLVVSKLPKGSASRLPGARHPAKRELPLTDAIAVISGSEKRKRGKTHGFGEMGAAGFEPATSRV